MEGAIWHGFYEFQPRGPDLTVPRDETDGTTDTIWPAFAASGGEAFRSRRQEWAPHTGTDGAMRTRSGSRRISRAHSAASTNSSMGFRRSETAFLDDPRRQERQQLSRDRIFGLKTQYGGADEG